MIKKSIDNLLISLYERTLRKKKNLIWKDLLKGFASLGFISTIGNDFKFLNKKYVSIGQNFCAGDHFRLEAIDNHNQEIYTPQIRIGNNVSFEDFCHIGCINSITIEDNVMIASKVFISDHSHGEINYQELQKSPRLRKLYTKGSIVIKKNVWIGDNVSVLSNVTIGENSIIGANSVVINDIPSNSIAAGIPAKVIKSFS